MLTRPVRRSESETEADACYSCAECLFTLASLIVCFVLRSHSASHSLLVFRASHPLQFQREEPEVRDRAALRCCRRPSRSGSPARLVPEPESVD